MRAAVLRVRAEALEPTLDRLLPVAPAGVYERREGPVAELVVPGAGPEVAAAARGALVEARERELPDGAEERVRELLPPPVIAGRFVVRAPGAPSPAPGLVDVVVERGSAFGTGLHPTTQRCLELLLGLEPHGAFADLGCGTGVLAIAAAKLGWAPVEAVDYAEASVRAAAANAARNGVEIAARQADLLAEPPPAAGTVAANVPLRVQLAVRERTTRAPRRLVVSGVTPEEADAVAAAWADAGLAERRRHVQSGWAAVLLASPEEPLRDAPVARDEPAATPPPADPPGLLPATLPGQLESELAGGATALSASRELPSGARVAVLLAPGLFRLDARHLEDTLKLSIRNLSGAPIRFLRDDGPPRTVVTVEDAEIERPLATNARMRILVAGRTADVVLSALSGIEPAAGRVLAQAVVGPAA